MKSNQLKDMITFALDKEKEAVEFYKTCSEQSTRSGMRQAFLEMAAEEKKHVQMLENFKLQNIKDGTIKEIPNLRISDYLVNMEFSSEMSYKDLLILAMKREESAYKMYSQMIVEGTDPSVERLFRFMAQEELKHKNRLEKEYDDFVLHEN